MTLSNDDILRIEGQFDCFCKKVLRNYARTQYRTRKRRHRYEILFAELPIGRIPEPVYINQRVLLDGYLFYDLGEPISIQDDILAQALRSLNKRKRKIILLYYFHGLTDRQIGNHFYVSHSTIQSARAKALKEMKQVFEKQSSIPHT